MLVKTVQPSQENQVNEITKSLIYRFHFVAYFFKLFYYEHFDYYYY